MIVVVGLYVWAVWNPDFLGLAFKYRASSTIAGIYDHARAAGTMGIALLDNILYPLGFSGILLAVLWDSRPAGRSDQAHGASLARVNWKIRSDRAS